VSLTDWEQRWLRWHRENYERHIRKRAAITLWHREMGVTTVDPDLVTEREDGGWNYYRRGVLPGSLNGWYLLVGVYWEEPQVAGISTAFATQTVEPHRRVVYTRP
jgi:hypothetical protein